MWRMEMPKHNRKGRDKSERFVKLPYYLLRSAAWLHLTPRERTAFLLIAERYNGLNNGRISLSIREIVLLGRMAANSASKALKTLEDAGFIKKTFNGSFSQKKPLASEFELTYQPTEKAIASKEFMKSKPKKNTVSKPSLNGIKLDPISHEGVL